METSKLIWLVAIAILAILVYYFLIKKMSPAQKSGILVRGVLFFGMIGYLTYDFYTKEKYWYILVLAAGSIAFVILLLSQKNREK